LPNITGQLNNDDTNVFNYADGVFKINNMYNKVAGSASGQGSNHVSFDASRSSSIYGNSSTVQPATCKCYFCIKY